MADAMIVDENDKVTVYPGVIFKKTPGRVILNAVECRFEDAWRVAWESVVKHQVSPASHPKAMLKLVLKTSSATFHLPSRDDLDRIRADITERLRQLAAKRKRPHSGLDPPSAFDHLDPTSLAVTRSSLLASNPALRRQHSYLTIETQTVSEDDFWETHKNLVEEEYAKITGYTKAGTSSLLQSALPSSGKVRLGVEEMRQIFILYPAVHKAYEEKVPLELSDEQFWRKYLESEYFHRDRGRMGTTAKNHSSGAEPTPQKPQAGLNDEQQEARAAAVGTDDMFSRYDQKLKERDPERSDKASGMGRRLAVGQFDLAATFATERGELLEGPKDHHPPNQFDEGGKGPRVIQKYNRHWAMVLHPDEAVAGANLKQVARRSLDDANLNDEDAKYGGGVDEEMQRLVDFASAPEEEADHAAGIGHHLEYEPLTLCNIEAYYVSQKANEPQSTESESEADRKHKFFAQQMVKKTESLVQKAAGNQLPKSCFPPDALGRELLSALTKKMANDSKTEAASLEMVNMLPEDFRQRLQTYFGRSSELLRHFFGLRRLEQETSNGNSGVHAQKLARIVRGMETFYREMEVMRKDLPQTETGELMRKMCLPIMGQLDWAFKLHREGSGGGGGGGFVAVDG